MYVPPAATGSGSAAGVLHHQAISAAEGLLADTIARLSRHAEGWVALVAHLSRLRPPAPRPHHRRVARAVLEDAGRAHDGQVFSLRNGDFVLLCRQAGLAARPGSEALPTMMARLLGPFAADPSEVATVWSLATDLAALRGFAEARMQEVAVPTATTASVTGAHLAIDAAAALASLASDAPLRAELLQRRVAILLSVGGPGATTMRPLHAAITVRLDRRAGQGGDGSPGSDPDLLRHVASQTDRQLLVALVAAQGSGSPLDGSRPLKLHIRLAVAAILGPEFARFAAVAPQCGIEIALVDAIADAAAFSRARVAIRAASMRLVLGPVSHIDLSIARPDALAPDLLTLQWAPAMADLQGDAAGQLAQAVARIGGGRILLDSADDEAALRWGLALGIRRFQGRHVDAMLAASRRSVCPDGCPLPQCRARGAACDPQGRAGCTNLPLLDAAMP